MSGKVRQNDKINRFQSSNISGREGGDGKEFATDVARYHSKDSLAGRENIKVKLEIHIETTYLHSLLGKQH